MANKFSSIDDALDIQAEEVEITPSLDSNENVKPIKNKDKDSNHLNSDYKFSRENNYLLSSKIEEAIEEMFEIAKQTQKGRDFEVLGNLIKIAKELDDGYLDRHEKVKRLEQMDGAKSGNITNQTTNALFVGTTAELQKFLKESLKKE
jgi:hypothetical protein